MSASQPPAPPGFIRVNNLGDPALIRVDRIAAVYFGTDEDDPTAAPATRIALDFPRGTRGQFEVRASDTVDEIGAAIARAVA
jgi:hypothetical protein